MTRSDALISTTRRLIDAGIPPDEVHVEARALLLRATGISREELFLRYTEPLSTSESATLEGFVRRREKREPLAYILGEREFFGLTFKVTPAVLIPRPETELLVQVALKHLSRFDVFVDLLDIGTGSGCIAIAVAVHKYDAGVYATDISAEALAVARENARRHPGAEDIRFFQGDLFAAIPPTQKFRVIVSNPPYIASSEIETLQPEVRDWEPRIALGENTDALHFYRRLAAEAPARLRGQGMLAVEVGQGQADDVAELWKQAGLEQISILNDLAGIPRVVIGIHP